MRPSQGFWGTWEKGHLRRTGEQRQYMYWGTWNIRKQILDFWGTEEQAYLFQGNNGTDAPNLPPPPIKQQITKTVQIFPA